MLTADEAIERVGGCGRGQMRYIILAACSHIGMAAFIMMMVFIGTNPLSAGLWECTETQNVHCMQLYSQHRRSVREVCRVLPSGSTARRFTQPSHSLISTFNLECSEWKLQLQNSMFFVGLALGGIGFGALSDCKGRHISMYASTLMAMLCALLCALSSSYAMYCVFRVLGGAAAQGMALAAVVYTSELVSPDYRGRIGIFVQSFFILGELLLPPLAYAIPAWRSLMLLVAAMFGAFLLTAPWVPESPRWLLLQPGRLDQACSVLAVIAHRNGKAVTADGLRQLHDSSSSSSSIGCLKTSSRDLISGNTNIQHPGGCHDVGKGPQLHGDEDVHADCDQASCLRLLSPLGSSSSTADFSAHIDAPVKAQGADGTQPVVLATTCHDDSASANIRSSINSKSPDNRQVGVFQALHHRLLFTYFLVLSYTLLTLVLVYYGVGFALGDLDGNIYMNFLYLCLAEIPSNFVGYGLIDRLGRIPLVLGGMTVSGVACCLCGVLRHSVAMQVLFASVGKFGCATAWSVLVVYCAEVLPTSVRSSLSGVIFQSARVGGVIAPFLFLMHTPSLPFYIMGISTLAGAALSLRLPESMGVPQPDTLDDVTKNAEHTLTKHIRSLLASNHAGNNAGTTAAAARNDASSSNSKPQGLSLAQSTMNDDSGAACGGYGAHQGLAPCPVAAALPSDEAGPEDACGHAAAGTDVQRLERQGLLTQR